MLIKDRLIKETGMTEQDIKDKLIKVATEGIGEELERRQENDSRTNQYKEGSWAHICRLYEPYGDQVSRMLTVLKEE